MKISSASSIGETEEHVRSFVIKQVEQNDVMATSNKIPDDDFKKADLDNKVIAPPYDPFALSVISESSGILGQCIDVMEVNVDSFGFELRPSVDDDTFEELNRDPAKKKEIEEEWQRVMNFFKYCNRTLSYTQLRRRFRRDYELTGNAYFEILRNQLTQKITGLEWLTSHTMRVARIDSKFTDYMARRKINDIEIEETPDKRKFRRYVQVKERQQKPVWFKEFGDPRLMDSETGGRAVVIRNSEGRVTSISPEVDSVHVFEVDKFEAGNMRLATEVLHFVNYQASRTLPYGSPRWIGNLISVMGSRQSEEVNLLYFNNKTVPPGMLLVSGGKLASSTVDRITNHIKENIKGSKNYHSILVVEANSGAPNPNLPAPPHPQLQWVSMIDAQHGDALFQNYDQNNIDKVISSFRFWSGYVSRTREINVATAEVARQISEEQVFQPERDEFDSIINRTLLVEMGINFWEHRTKGPQLSSPKAMADILDKMKPYLTGIEGREIAKLIFGREFKDLKDEWVQKPLTLVIAELVKGAQAANDAIASMRSGKIPASGQGGVKDPASQQAEELKKMAELPNDEQAVLEFVTKLITVREALSKAEVVLSENAMRGPI